MKYKILIPVVAEVKNFWALLQQIPDKTKLIVVNNLDHPEIAEMCLELEKVGAEVHWCPWNAGCAGSHNIGLKHFETEPDLDFLIIMSPSCDWESEDVTDFAKAIEASEKEEKKYMYIANGQFRTDMHAFAITRKNFEIVGYYDENFHPVYFEDTDYCQRQKIAGIERTELFVPRKSRQLGGGAAKDPRVWWQYLKSAQRIHDYYSEKWGGEHMSEKYTHPFNDPNLTIKDWTLREDELVQLNDEDGNREFPDA